MTPRERFFEKGVLDEAMSRKKFTHEGVRYNYFLNSAPWFFHTNGYTSGEPDNTPNQNTAIACVAQYLRYRGTKR